MANDCGYIIIDRDGQKVPPSDLFKAIEHSIGQKHPDIPSSSAAVGGQRFDGGRLSEQVLHFKTHFSDVSWFQDVLGCTFDEAMKSTPQIIFWLENPKPLPRYPAGPPSTAYIYCTATGEELNDSNGLFRIVDGSHRMTRAEIDRTRATPVTLKPFQILIMSAALTIEYPQTGGGIGIWMRVSRQS